MFHFKEFSIIQEVSSMKVVCLGFELSMSVSVPVSVPVPVPALPLSCTCASGAKLSAS